ncbi:hypothetical protein DCC81_24675 [Chitinophaga parva]|uniref:DUF7666 domain-containing protein n=2 Tax=Chitinophaga parva TaxID=2169414 RepID=A0A2T7BBM0_9BACT|nr:hypothetical protein DCC81_24675 [Chitinophaga parva]
MKNYQLPADKVLILRTCKNDMSSYNGFIWPESGFVEAPDWNDDTKCGHGLHGWLFGSGDYDLKYKEVGAKWLVVEVEANQVRELKGKVKFKNGTVIYSGGYKTAYDLVMKWFWIRHAAELKAMELVDGAATTSSEDGVSVVTTKDKSHASATGYYGHASATGYSGHASATGYSGHASATGESGHASATGESGHASATGNYGHASATGYSGHASATGNYGHASATGNYGHAVVLGQYGKAQCGENGAVILTYWDGKRLRHIVGYAGEGGIESGKWYMLNGKNELIETTVEK